MTNGDNSADDPNRTVFRPSPLAGLGGGQSQSLGTAGGAPAARSPLAAAAAASPRAARLDDAGIPAPSTPREIRAPLVAEAAPILAIAASIRSGRARIGLDAFHREASDALGAYDRAVAPHYPEETRSTARYLLAATVDDIAGNLPNLDGSAGWEGRSLVSQQFSGGFSEDALWTQLDHALEKPEDHSDLIELAFACIAAGFQGRYRSQPGGGDELEKRSEKLYKALDHTRALSQRFVSPQWVGFNAPLQKVATVNIIALALAAALVLVLLAYIGLRVATQSDTAADAASVEESVA